MLGLEWPRMVDLAVAKARTSPVSYFRVLNKV